MGSNQFLITDERYVTHKTKTMKGLNPGVISTQPFDIRLKKALIMQSKHAPMKLPWKTTLDINSLTCEFANTER